MRITYKKQKTIKKHKKGGVKTKSVKTTKTSKTITQNDNINNFCSFYYSDGNKYPKYIFLKEGKNKLSIVMREKLANATIKLYKEKISNGLEILNKNVNDLIYTDTDTDTDIENKNNDIHILQEKIKYIPTIFILSLIGYVFVFKKDKFKKFIKFISNNKNIKKYDYCDVSYIDDDFVDKDISTIPNVYENIKEESVVSEKDEDLFSKLAKDKEINRILGVMDERKKLMKDKNKTLINNNKIYFKEQIKNFENFCIDYNEKTKKFYKIDSKKKNDLIDDVLVLYKTTTEIDDKNITLIQNDWYLSKLYDDIEAFTKYPDFKKENPVATIEYIKSILKDIPSILIYALLGTKLIGTIDMMTQSYYMVFIKDI